MTAGIEIAPSTAVRYGVASGMADRFVRDNALGDAVPLLYRALADLATSATAEQVSAARALLEKRRRAATEMIIDQLPGHRVGRT